MLNSLSGHACVFCGILISPHLYIEACPHGAALGPPYVYPCTPLVSLWTRQTFACLSQTRFCYVDQAGIELVNLSQPPPARSCQVCMPISTSSFHTFKYVNSTMIKLRLPPRAWGCSSLFDLCKHLPDSYSTASNSYLRSNRWQAEPQSGAVLPRKLFSWH